MKFAYKRYTIDSRTGTGDEQLYRPMVPLRVVGPTGDAYVWALLDTGADETLLPLSMSETLGVETNAGADWSVSGIGGQPLSVITGNVTFRIAEGDQSLEWNATVGFVDFDNPEDEMAILGHRWCLEFFRATFDGGLREVDLVPLGEIPARER